MSKPIFNKEDSSFFEKKLASSQAGWDRHVNKKEKKVRKSFMFPTVGRLPRLAKPGEHVSLWFGGRCNPPKFFGHFRRSES